MKQYKRNLIIIFALACFALLRFMSNFEDMAGIQTRNPDMDTYEMHNDLYYYSSYESGFFTYDPSTKEIVKLSNYKATDSSIHFQSGYVFFKEYRGRAIVRMDENGDNEKVLFDKKVYKYRVYDEKIYFINGENRKLYSSNLEGEDLKIEIDSTFSGLRIEDGYLYLLGKYEQVDLKLYFESGKIEEVPE